VMAFKAGSGRSVRSADDALPGSAAGRGAR
jgi:hypothetical protein